MNCEIANSKCYGQRLNKQKNYKISFCVNETVYWESLFAYNIGNSSSLLSSKSLFVHVHNIYMIVQFFCFCFSLLFVYYSSQLIDNETKEQRKNIKYTIYFYRSEYLWKFLCTNASNKIKVEWCFRMIEILSMFMWTFFWKGINKSHI